MSVYHQMPNFIENCAVHSCFNNKLHVENLCSYLSGLVTCSIQYLQRRIIFSVLIELWITQNLLLSADGDAITLKIGDFGFARWEVYSQCRSYRTIFLSLKIEITGEMQTNTKIFITVICRQVFLFPQRHGLLVLLIFGAKLCS